MRNIKNFYKNKRISIFIGIIGIILFIFLIVLTIVFKPNNQIENPSSTISANIEDSSKEISTNSISVNPLLMIITLMAFLVSVTSMILLLTILFKKKIVVGDEVFLVPDEIAKKIKLLDSHISNLRQNIYSWDEKSDSVTKETSNAINDIKSVLNTYLKVLDEKDGEIRKYKDGYNSYLYEKFILRFIRIDRDLAEIHESGHVDLEDINQLKILMKHALSECGVELFEPPIGKNYNDTKGVADNPKISETEDEDKDFLIKEIIQPGYRQNNGDSQKDIVPAKVVIFRKI